MLFIRPDGRFDDLDRSGELVLSVGLHNWRGFHHFVAGSLLQIGLNTKFYLKYFGSQPFKQV